MQKVCTIYNISYSQLCNIMQLGVWSIFGYLNRSPTGKFELILLHVCFLCQDSSLPLVCDLLGVTVDQMNNVLEHKTFEELPFILKDQLFWFVFTERGFESRRICSSFLAFLPGIGCNYGKDHSKSTFQVFQVLYFPGVFNISEVKDIKSLPMPWKFSPVRTLWLKPLSIGRSLLSSWCRLQWLAWEFWMLSVSTMTLAASECNMQNMWSFPT